MKKEITNFSELLDIDISPMMNQYVKIKHIHQDSLLLFRLGDFYEMFFTDAQIASKELGIVLTKKGITKNIDIPMCGIPFHSYESYLNRLIKRGYKVSICEQTETPEEAKKRGSKSVVNREVTRIVTPGTLTEDALLEQDSYNYLLCIHFYKKECFVSWIDISTGSFYCDICNLETLNSLIYKINPSEILVSNKFDTKYLLDDFNNIISFIAEEKFNIISATGALKDYFSDQFALLNDYKDEEKISCFVLLDYVLLTRKTLNIVNLPKKILSKDFLRVDLFTQKSLEILKSYNSSPSLKRIIDKTVTAFGSRKLSDILINVLSDKNHINQRLDLVDFLISNEDISENLIDILKNMPDAERCLSRLGLNNGNILDVASIRSFLQKLQFLKAIIFSKFSSNIPVLLQELLGNIGNYNNLLGLLESNLIDNITIKEKDGGFVKLGSNADLDSALKLKEECLQEILSLREKYVLYTKISNLKISFNNISGYYIEVPGSKADVLFNDTTFKHKQTLSNTARFTTSELLEIEGRINKSVLLATNLERDVLNKCIKEIVLVQKSLLGSIGAIAFIDVFLSFYKIAIEFNLVKPIIDDSKCFDVKNARHIVVEQSLKSKNAEFVANDCVMEENKNIFLITGPNMAGKSTYLRQNAIIIILAQIGSYVPAEFAHIGVVDALFSRVGASDDLSKGQSTFMLEMTELSVILNNATDKSFLILDEIGRGTSTVDGLSIAWSTLEHLNNVLCSRTLFATHYHELVNLESKLQSLICYHVAISENNGNIIFMHNVLKGSVSKSYGLEVAKIAGLPMEVITRANDIMMTLEGDSDSSIDLMLRKPSGNVKKNMIVSPNQGSIFFDNIPKIDDFNEKFISKIMDVDSNTITPRQALDLIYNLQDEYKSRK